MVTIFKDFFANLCTECVDFSTGMTRYDVLDKFSFDLKSLAKKMKEL